MRQLSVTEREDIASGAAFLGSGGGAPVTQFLPLIKLIAEPVELIDIAEVGDEQWGAVSSGIGAGSAESIPSSNVSDTASPHQSMGESTIRLFENILKRNFEFLEQILHQNLSYVLSGEIGIGSFLLVLLTAISKKIPIVDCDGAGRSVPQLEMTTYAASSIPVSPLILANVQLEKDDMVQIVIQAKTASMMEQLVRKIAITDEFGGGGLTANYAMNGKALREQQPAIAGTISLAQKVGFTLRQAKEQGNDPVEAILNVFNDVRSGKNQRAFKLFQGTICQVEGKFGGGFQRGSLTLKNGDRQVRVIYKNENMIAWGSDRQPIAMAPDLICYLTLDGLPLTNADNLKTGDEIALIGLKAQPQLRQDSIVRAFLGCLKQLGYEGSYIPIEQLQG